MRSFVIVLTCDHQVPFGLLSPWVFVKAAGFEKAVLCSQVRCGQTEWRVVVRGFVRSREQGESIKRALARAVCNGRPPSIPFGRKGSSLSRKSRGNRKRYTLSRKRSPAKRNLGLAREQGNGKAEPAREQVIEKAALSLLCSLAIIALSLQCSLAIFALTLPRSLATTGFRLAGRLPGFSLRRLVSERQDVFVIAVWPNGMAGGAVGVLCVHVSRENRQSVPSRE